MRPRRGYRVLDLGRNVARAWPGRWSIQRSLRAVNGVEQSSRLPVPGRAEGCRGVAITGARLEPVSDPRANAYRSWPGAHRRRLKSLQPLLAQGHRRLQRMVEVSEELVPAGAQVVLALRLDPFERLAIDQSFLALEHFYGREFWRFVFVQQEVAKLGQTAIDFPPMQPGASFNLEAVKEDIKKAISSRTGN